jgi:hypothetical protein
MLIFTGREKAASIRAFVSNEKLQTTSVSPAPDICGKRRFPETDFSGFDSRRLNRAGVG